MTAPAPTGRRGGARPGIRALPALLALLAIELPGPAAHAAPRAPAPDLAVRRLPAPSPGTLRMRPLLARSQVAAPGTTARPPAGATRPAGTRPGAPSDDALPATGDDDARKQRRMLRALPLQLGPALAERVVFRFNLGFGIDGGEPSNAPMLTGSALSATEYARVRTYSFGEAVLGSRGILAPSLSTYLAAQFRYDQDFGRTVTAVPSVHDGEGTDDVQVRSGYGEVNGPFDIAWLEPLYVRAGRQYRYGPVVAHFDGLSVGYDTRALSVGAFAGRGVDVHGFSHGAWAANDGAMAGLSLRLDFFELERAPLVLSGNLLGYDGHSHIDGALALRWSRDISLQAGLRGLDGNMARQYLRVRARISAVSVATLDVENRSRGDWMYDALAIGLVEAGGPGGPGRPGGPPDPRRYLNLGPPLPRTYLSLRAGTVLLDNIDLLVRGGAAIEHRDRDEPASTFSAGFAEAGAALEVRVRRTLALGAGVLTRRYDRATDAADQDTDELGDDDVAGVLDLADTGHLGERSFVEAGTTARFTLGARRFSADAELYMRYYDLQPLYSDLALDRANVHGGGRFGVEGWAGDSLRVKAEYEVSSTLATIPELRGIKSLRVLLEGRL